MVKKKIIGDQDLLEQLVAGLKRTAHSPTIAGYHPMEHQQKFHASSAKGRGYIGGNRSGKTVGGGTESVWRLKGEHPYQPVPPAPVKGRGVASDFDHGVALIMLPMIARWIPPSLLKNGSWEASYSKGERILSLENGSTMEFLSCDQDVDKHAGTSRDFVWFDEEPPEEHFNENLIRLMDTGGKWWMTMTPVEGMSWTYDRIYLPGTKGLDPNIFIVTVSTDENIHIASAEIDAYLSGMSKEEKEARRKGIYVQLGGLIYKGLSADNIIPDLLENKHKERWENVKTNWHHFAMMDAGYSNPTVFLFGAYDAERIIIYDEYYVAGEVVKTHAFNVKQRIEELGVVTQYIVGDPSIRAIDPVKGISISMEYAENGVYIVEGNNDVRAGINRVANLIENRKLFITRRCEKLLWEMQRYRWGQWASKKIAARSNLKEEPLKKDDHACDALRYGVASLPAFYFEVGEVAKNVLGVPEVFDSDDEFKDRELMPGYVEKIMSQCSTLGSEW